MRRLINLAYLLSLGVFLVSCATAERLQKRGDNFLALGEYAEAAGQYKRAYNLTSPKDHEKRGFLQYRMAECFRKYGYTARAVGAYKSAARYNYTDTLTYYWEGEMLRKQGDYKGARKAYESQLEITPNHEGSLQGLTSCDISPDIKAAGSAYSVKIEPLFNGSRADYSPAFMGTEADQLYYSTTRSQATGDDYSGITGEMAADIYYSKKDDKGNWTRPEGAEGSLNSEFDEGACQFSADGKTMYLTICRTDADYPRMAEIWTASRSDATWAKPQQLKITSDTLSSYAHPAPSADGRWLYFVSDMPGGFGGLDIWRASLSSKGVGTVENLGPKINTKGDEMFPTTRYNGELYFSSNGKEGLGGMDIFKAVEDTMNKTWIVEHLPAPMNSNGDDFGMTFEGKHNRGYFSSNRSTGGRGWDKIYSFSYPERLTTVKGWVYEQDGYELTTAQVYMVGDDGTNEKVAVLSDGSFEREVKPGVNYVFLAVCNGFLNYQNELKVPKHLTEETQYVLQFPMPSMNIPVLVRNVFYEFDKADLTPESVEALDRLVKLLTQNKHITIELSSHCDYRGEDDYNLALSQRRAESVVNYLTEHGVSADRLQAKGYGEKRPKIVNKKLTETHTFLHTGDTLTLDYVLKLDSAKQEVCNALNRRTEFRVLRTTYGLFDEKGNVNVDAVKADVKNNAALKEEEDKEKAVGKKEEEEKEAEDEVFEYVE